MPSLSRSSPTEQGEMAIASAYNEAGYRYGRYADGSARNLFTFDGRHAYSDRKAWDLIEVEFWNCARAACEILRVLDIGCGPGTWLRRVVVRARQLGFEITAQGIDIADAQVNRARALSRPVGGSGWREPVLQLWRSARQVAVRKFRSVSVPVRRAESCPGAGTARCVRPAWGRRQADISSPRYAPWAALRLSMSMMSLPHCVSIRTTGSTGWMWNFPTAAATASQSHLFSRAELLRLASVRFELDDVCGLDLFQWPVRQ